MKKILIFMTLVIYSQNLFAACIIKVDCIPLSTNQELITQQLISNAYDNLDNQIQNSQDNYNEYYNSLNEQNELLTKIIKVRKYNNLQMEKVNFLLSKIINNKNVTIDINTIKSIKRLNSSILQQENK